ncbi:RagB/SusD family nutrient uptake outer membrane protein [Flavobacterium sufflavum]|uniref:RagB/SusD family nutrient uptake outer membrane protein n=1 Tax=Flavobacterium sufflavum TaxID=1921138 RepID=A0A437L2U9_9FLAO|nr:RagB/SusD family nutrient uptake outer membrane protein [Flavobacterium sufflavum]RVT79629.1 RagB/SusD family nutrient uptake outer membrane protein [Flavobacterium sufflavum]
MKKIIIIFSLLALLTGCDNGLDPEIYGSLTPANFPKTESEYELYTLEVYKPFTSKWGYSDGGISQNLFWGYEYSNVQLNDACTDLMSVAGAQGLFQEISKANFLILKNENTRSHIEKIRYISKITTIIGDLEKATTISETAKARFIAESKTARGILMYHLLTMYGPVPVILDANLIGTDAEKNLTRPERGTYVNGIIQDLLDAANVLEKSPSQYGRFNKGLALTYLMRTYLNEKDWSNAEIVGREIVDLGYNLVSNYKSLFVPSTERNTETIYAISTDASANGGGLLGNMNAYSWYCYPVDFPGITQNGGWLGPNAFFTASWEFYDSFDPADKRRELLIPSYLAVNNRGGIPAGGTRDRSNMSGAVIMKYPDVETSSFARGNDIPLARYADVLLMLAEAINNQDGPTSEAIGMVNSVRSKHGGLNNLSAGDTATKDAFAAAILKERGWDLFFEGYRRIDLIRFGKWNQALQSVGKTPGPALFPIPEYKIQQSNNKLSQTDGWQ